MRYRDFRTACHVGDVANGIGGANCRHSYAAYFPGMRRSYRPNPKHPSGLSNKEAYELTQQQRGLEREIRAAKRELRGAEQLYAADPTVENLAAVSKSKEALKARQASMRKLVADNPKVLQRSPRREWAGDMPKGMTQKQIKVAFSTSRQSETPQWSNAAVSALKTPDDVAQYVAMRHGANVSPGFKGLPMSAQRDVVAGMDDAVGRYGDASINTVSTMRSSANDGSYAPDTGTIKINETASSHYLAGFHETIHAIDAEKSSKMKAFVSAPASKAYNMHSEKVLKEARKALGLSRSTRKCNDLVIQLMGWDPILFESEGRKSYEVVAYALDYETQGHSNALSRAIVERF